MPRRDAAMARCSRRAFAGALDRLRGGSALRRCRPPAGRSRWPRPSIAGLFRAAAAAAETQLEQRFDSDLSAADLRSWMEQMSSEPNHVGSAHDKANAEFQLQKFREWGWDASIETFSVLYPTPREVSVELVAPTHFTARLTEPPIAGDRTSSKTKDELPAYNVYGADGDVTAELVYVNHGMPDDYRELERQGVSVKGRIVLTRYGGGWRGLKPKLAYEHGAVGCLIYSDPRDDGYGAGDTYPKGGYRPPDAVQRGSVQDLVLYSGDPLTPGVGATAGRQETGDQGCQDHIENSGVADLLCGGATAARGARRAAWRRPAGAADCRSPITWVRVRRRCISKCFPTGIKRRCTTSLRRSAAPRNPIDGSFAAIIMMAGCSVPPIRSPAKSP